MKRLLAYLLLLFNFIFVPIANSNDLSEFGIEGINIGDSLLEHYSKKNIKKAKKKKYKSDEFITIYVKKKNFVTYDLVMASVKKKDKKYKIYSLTGVIDYKSNINECYSMLDVISEGIKNIYPLGILNFKERPHPVDKSGKSKLTQYFIKLNNGNIMAGCTDYSKKFEKEKGRNDFLMISLKNTEFENFISNKAY